MKPILLSIDDNLLQSAVCENEGLSISREMDAKLVLKDCRVEQSTSVRSEEGSLPQPAKIISMAPLIKSH